MVDKKQLLFNLPLHFGFQLTLFGDRTSHHLFKSCANNVRMPSSVAEKMAIPIANLDVILMDKYNVLHIYNVQLDWEARINPENHS